MKNANESTMYNLNRTNKQKTKQRHLNSSFQIIKDTSIPIFFRSSFNYFHKNAVYCF